MSSSTDHVLSLFSGLTEAEVLQRRKESGKNKLPPVRKPTAWSAFFSQLKSPLLYLLLAAAVASLLAGETWDFVIVMVVVVINVIVGFAGDRKAQRTSGVPAGPVKPTVTAMRDDTRKEIEVCELVPEDTVLLHAGERVPGDGEVILGVNLSVDEAILTGDSEPVMKNEEPGRNRVFMGTTVTTGRGLMRVTATGPRTELGQTASSLRAGKEAATPLRVRLRIVSRTLFFIVSLVTAAILLFGVISGRRFLEMLRVAIVLVVAAVPEGLLIAMIGDGVHDAPALKRTNVSVVVRYALCCSCAEALTILGAMIFGWPAPLAVAQVLWINVICSGLSGIVLGLQQKALRKPRSDGLTFFMTAVFNVACAVAALVCFDHFFPQDGSLAEARSFLFAAFSAGCIVSLFFFHSGSLLTNKPLLAAVAGGLALVVGVFFVPPLRTALGLVPLALPQWSMVAAAAGAILCIAEIDKLIANRVSPRSVPATMEQGRQRNGESG